MRQDIIWLCDRAMRFQSKTHITPLLAIESPVAQWLEHPTRSRRVVGSYPIWYSDFFPSQCLNLENFYFESVNEA